MDLRVLGCGLCVCGMRVSLFFGFADHCKLIREYQTKKDFTYLSYWAFVHPAVTHTLMQAHIRTEAVTYS